MKKFIYALYALVAFLLIGLLIYEYAETGTIASRSLSKCIVVLAGIVVGILRSIGRDRKQVINKKALYSKAYAEFIGNAFANNPKQEKVFYSALDALNRNKLDVCIKKLSSLLHNCYNSQDRCALEFFLGLCKDDMQLYEEAIKHYSAAQHIRPNSSIASNIGLCYDRMGKLADSARYYQEAIQLDPNNPFPYNNLAQQALRTGNYIQGVEYARQALSYNANMTSALNAMAICSYMTGDMDGYETYYRQAVSNGTDGNQLKAYIAALNTD